jgi:hypothetical protein
MAATQSYVITVGTTPVPRRALSTGHRVRRRGDHVVRIASIDTTVVYSRSANRPGAHRVKTAGPVRRERGAHRASATTAPGRHRATRAQLRQRHARRTRGALILRGVVPAFVILLIGVLFVGAWFSASDAVAFASIVQP